LKKEGKPEVKRALKKLEDKRDLTVLKNMSSKIGKIEVVTKEVSLNLSLF